MHFAVLEKNIKREGTQKRLRAGYRQKGFTWKTSPFAPMEEATKKRIGGQGRLKGRKVVWGQGVEGKGNREGKKGRVRGRNGGEERGR